LLPNRLNSWLFGSEPTVYNLSCIKQSSQRRYCKSHMRSDSHTATNKACFIVTSMHVTRHTHDLSVACPRFSVSTRLRGPHGRSGHFPPYGKKTADAAPICMHLAMNTARGHVLHSDVAIALLGPTAIYYIQVWRLHCWDPRPYVTFSSGDCNAGTHGHILHSGLVIILLGPTGHMSHSSAQW
jgi:hypothetical protein